MSFDLISDYARPILQPICVNSEQAPSPLTNKARPVPSTSRNWQATVHTFVGTEIRITPTSWPASRFNEDPSNIPDDAEFDVRYEPDSAAKHEPGSAKGTYRMYEQELGQSGDDAQQVPSPRIVVKRYIPNMPSSSAISQHQSGLTLLMLPGMGLPKEAFEPMIEGLLPQLQGVNAPVAEIWSVDMPMSGETPLVNPQGFLYGNEKDIARDLLLFITAYLPVQPQQKLPSELVPRTHNQTGQQSVRQNLHVVAHSLGAQSAMLIAAHAPKLFASLTVFDPAMIPNGKIRETFTKLPKDTLCTNIKARHASKSALMEEVKTNRRTRNWDERIMKIFVEHGAVPDGFGGLRVVAHPRLEWALYYDKETPTHCYDRLQDIRVPLNAVMPERPFAVPAKMFAADLAKLPQKTRLTWIPKSSHQLPFERVGDCTEHVASWLKDLAGGDRAKL